MDRETFGRRSRELATKIGDWDKNMTEIENIYNNLEKGDMNWLLKLK